MTSPVVYLTLGSLMIAIFCCTSCSGCDEDRVAVCNDTSVVTEVAGNIRKYQTYSEAAEKINGVYHAYFTISSPSKRKRVKRPSSCAGQLNVFISAVMEPGDFMQANNYRYTGVMCSPRKFTKTNKSILFGMKVENATTSTSNFTVGFICHISDMVNQARALFSCDPVVKYIMSSADAFSTLADYLRSSTDKSITIGRNPGKHMCQIFKHVIKDCKKEGFGHVYFENC